MTCKTLQVYCFGLKTIKYGTIKSVFKMHHRLLGPKCRNFAVVLNTEWGGRFAKITQIYMNNFKTQINFLKKYRSMSPTEPFANRWLITSSDDKSLLFGTFCQVCW